MTNFKSSSELRFSNILKTHDIKNTYEPFRIDYEVKPKKYTPDFVFSNGVIIEVKGRFVATDRMKHLYIKAQLSKFDIRFVFDNPKRTLYKRSKTTYADWCNKHGFKFCSIKDIDIIKQWAKEKKD